MEDVGTNGDGFRSAESSQSNAGASVDALDREPLGGISHVRDLDNEEGGNIGEKNECSSQQGTAKSPEKFKIGKPLIV